MPPEIIIEDTFSAPDGTNINDYNDWTFRNNDWTVNNSCTHTGFVFQFSDPGGKTLIKQLYRPVYTSSVLSFVFGWFFYDDDVSEYDVSGIVLSSFNDNKKNFEDSGLRFRASHRFSDASGVRLRFYYDGVVVYDQTLTIGTNRSQAFLIVTIEPDGTGNIIYAETNGTHVDALDIPNYTHPQGRYIGFITDENGPAAGPRECWSMTDRINLTENFFGSVRIRGQVRRNNLLLEGARVTCVTHADDSFSGRQTTGADGLYDFTDLDEDESYDLMATYTQGTGAYTSLCRAAVVPRFEPD